MDLRILKTVIQSELDVVGARQRARSIAVMCNFGIQDQARIATAVSELARNVYSYAGSGTIAFGLEGSTSPQVLVIQVEDNGPGIRDVELVLSGLYKSRTGMGLGLVGVRRLMDQFDLKSTPQAGTRVIVRKLLPQGAPLVTPAMLAQYHPTLAEAGTSNLAFNELQQQNQELLQTLSELKTRQEELLQLTRELEDTNRGVVALYAELDEKAGHLRRADELKSRFLSNMSHEFRTPLNSIRALGNMLLSGTDGEVNDEQARQLGYVIQSAESLTELVNDLLDIAKIEAGRIEVRRADFSVGDLFSTLRGMLRPLLVSPAVRLVFDDAGAALSLSTDEAKVSQILRNFISNALKFTQAGEIRVTATLEDLGRSVRFSVSDTGIGIAPENHGVIFEEFSQVEHPLQRQVKGTGLGLPLCRKLAGLLGGRVELESEVGKGSVFSAILPLRYLPPEPEVAAPTPRVDAASLRNPVLIVEDDQQTILVYRKYLGQSGFDAVFARTVGEAELVWSQVSPVAVVLDIQLNGESTWRWLAELKGNERRRRVPVIVASVVDDMGKGYALGAEAYFLKPVAREDLLTTLERLTGTNPGPAAAVSAVPGSQVVN